MDARLGPYDTDYQGLWPQLSESWPLFHRLHIAQDLGNEFENISIRSKLKRGVLSLRLSRGSPVKAVFTSDGDGVVIRSVELYDLVKTAFRFFWFRLRLCRLRSSKSWVVGVASRSGRTKPITKRGNVHCDWFILPLLLPTPTIWFSLDHKRNVSDGVVSGVGRKWKRSDSSDSDSVCLWIRLRLQFMVFTRS